MFADHGVHLTGGGSWLLDAKATGNAAEECFASARDAERFDVDHLLATQALQGLASVS